MNATDSMSRSIRIVIVVSLVIIIILIFYELHNDNNTKLGRFLISFKGVQKNRKGVCIPDQCETLDGKKGAACCRLSYKCPVLCDTNCGVYSIRPINCRVFPISEADLNLVKNCSYHFGQEKLTGQ
jgi:Fe-S-cluster containining protein